MECTDHVGGGGGDGSDDDCHCQGGGVELVGDHGGENLPKSTSMLSHSAA